MVGLHLLLFLLLKLLGDFLLAFTVDTAFRSINQHRWWAMKQKSHIFSTESHWWKWKTTSIHPVYLISRCIWSVGTPIALSVCHLCKLTSSLLQHQQCLRCESSMKSTDFSKDSRHQLFTASSIFRHRKEIHERSGRDKITNRKGLLWSQMTSYILQVLLTPVTHGPQNHLNFFS